jgi:hypothetical protein
MFGTTPEHPFWVEGRGWIPAQMLKTHDRLLANGRGAWEVLSVIDNTERADTFNFEVKGLHNYLIGHPGVLVHNQSKAQLGVPDESFVPNANVTTPYVRLRAAGPTPEQNASVQGQPCVVCGAVTPKQVADHKEALSVIELAQWMFRPNGRLTPCKPIALLVRQNREVTCQIS